MTPTTFPQRWNLDVLLPAPETAEFRKVFESFRKDLSALADQSETLPAVSSHPESLEAWTVFLKKYEAVQKAAEDFESFIGCHAAADAGNKLYQQLEGELAALRPLRERIRTNMELALQAASETELELFIASANELKEIAFFLRDCRQQARLRLPKEQELLAADLGVDGLHAWGRFYDRISGALKIRVMERGEIVEKSPGQVQFDMPERPVRENNFFAANKAWQSLADDCADALNHISGSRLSVYRRLPVEDHLDAPLRFNRMQRKTLQTMWETITSRKSMLLDYLQAKGRLLGVERLAWYDLTAPLVPGKNASSTTDIPYQEACATIIHTFSGFSEELGDFARQALSGGWVETENRPGKRQGGFCTGFPGKEQSRIFMTYTNSRDSMSTLAHELGHAYHSYVLREKPFLLRDYPMNLAETASTFAEAVLGEQQLTAARTREEKLQILDVMLSDAVAFLMNIHARFLFEDRFHRERQEGELSAERFTELMLAAQKEAYLDALAEDGWNPQFWISKLHFYISTWPFYNFPYTFGYLLSLGLFSLAEHFGNEFPGKYREFLLLTGSAETEEAVQETLGCDLGQPDFWNRCLDVVQQRVAQFIELAG